MLKNPIDEKLHRYRNEVDAATKDIERLEQERKTEWATIKDFGTVDAIRAEAGAKRIERLNSEISKLTKKRNKALKFIEENGSYKY